MRGILNEAFLSPNGVIVKKKRKEVSLWPGRALGFYG